MRRMAPQCREGCLAARGGRGINDDATICPRSSVDRALASGASGAGSSPAGGTRADVSSQKSEVRPVWVLISDI